MYFGTYIQSAQIGRQKNYSEVTSEHPPKGGFYNDCPHMRMLEIDNRWLVPPREKNRRAVRRGSHSSLPRLRLCIFVTYAVTFAGGGLFVIKGFSHPLRSRACQSSAPARLFKRALVSQARRRNKGRSLFFLTDDQLDAI